MIVCTAVMKSSMTPELLCTTMANESEQLVACETLGTTVFDSVCL